MFKNQKILILVVGALLITATNFAFAAGPSISVSPSSLEKEKGQGFNLSIVVDGAGQKVCAVEGKISLSNLSCQSIVLSDGLSAQASPTCADLNFLLGIQGCNSGVKNLFTLTVKSINSGSASVAFSNVDIVGEGVPISSASLGGSYTIISPCDCGDWSAWQDGACGGGNCSSIQRLQTRTRTCAPFGCEAKDEYRCVDDSGCIPRLPSTEIEEGEVKGEAVIEQPAPEAVIEQPAPEAAIEQPAQEEAEESQEVETGSLEEKIIQKSLLTNLIIVWEKITGSAWLIIITILCLSGLVIIVMRKWRLRRKKK